MYASRAGGPEFRETFPSVTGAILIIVSILLAIELSQ